MSCELGLQVIGHARCPPRSMVDYQHLEGVADRKLLTMVPETDLESIAWNFGQPVCP